LYRLAVANAGMEREIVAGAVQSVIWARGPANKQALTGSVVSLHTERPHWRACQTWSDVGGAMRSIGREARCSWR
jgi:hypothetical protein